MEERSRRYGVLGNRFETDWVLYENEDWYICMRNNEVRYFHKQVCDHDGDEFIGYGELNQDVVPSGFLHIISTLITEISILQGLLDSKEGRTHKLDKFFLEEGEE